jgi:hypothetical protein
MADEATKSKVRRSLLSARLYDELGTWRIVGECGVDGSAGQDYGYYEGYYGVIVDYALDLPQFITYGKGGYITKLKINELDKKKIEELAALRKQQAELEDKLLTIKSMIEHRQTAK